VQLANHDGDQARDPARGASAQFQAEVMPHVSAAYNLARWLVRSEHDAQDVVQEACVRALRFFDNYRGVDGRGWFLAIVRNTAHSWLRRNRQGEPMRLDDADASDERLSTSATDPSTLAVIRADREQVREAIEELPVEFREVVVLRELEGMSYKQIADVADVPIGTVMSRLSRARAMLQRRLSVAVEGGVR
jgi:RNA polymerase sigma-70 factor (ECF subfamily)